ncbi:hypothetical protein J6590_095536 [Homalodisca vitripennis]|nr:hypothetical protein J6590_095536 [Homalodisca vitripennis]
MNSIAAHRIRRNIQYSMMYNKERERERERDYVVCVAKTNLGNIIDVQERHTTNCKFLNSGALVCSVHSQRVNGSCQPRHKCVPPLIFFDLRGWLIAGFPFLRPLL